MPTYSYRCADCGHAFDQFQKFSEDPLTECPACGGAVKRVIHPVGVVFKGSGWYITDSRKSNGSEPGADGDGKAKSEKTEPVKAETTEKKPEPKAKEGAAASA